MLEQKDVDCVLHRYGHCRLHNRLVLSSTRDTRKRENSLHGQEQSLNQERERLNEEKERHKEDVALAETALARKRDDIEHYQANRQQEFERLLEQARDLKVEFSQGFLRGRKWLANAYAEFISMRDAETECSLVVKPNPAWKAAEMVSQLRTKRVEMARTIKILEYQLESYEEYFPFLIDYRDAILDEVIDMRTGAVDAIEDLDPALSFGYLSKHEYHSLTTVEKFQLALDRYWQKHKSDFEIGRLYERYIGYLYEQDGWTVHYQGIREGFEDFGRDLICMKNGRVAIVQCKCWSKHKVIREKHVMQLYGTCAHYRFTERQKFVSPVFVTTTNLSEEASMVASELGIEVQHKTIERYPMIKCNVNPGTKEPIYHLPFDQQYDRIIIGNQQGEFYAETVKEAEAAGFRRAYRWRGGETETHCMNLDTYIVKQGTPESKLLSRAGFDRTWLPIAEWKGRRRSRGGFGKAPVAWRRGR